MREASVIRSPRRLVLMAATLAAACASGAKEPARPPLPSDGPKADVTVAIRTGGGIPTPTAQAVFRLDQTAYALVAEVKNGRVRVLYPPTLDSTGLLPARQYQFVDVDPSVGEVYLLSKSSPFDMSSIVTGRTFADWDAMARAQTMNADTAIRRFAVEVGASGYRITRADRRVGTRPGARGQTTTKTVRPGCRQDPRTPTKQAPISIECIKDP